MSRLVRVLVVLTVAGLAPPASAFAQASIAGLVKDTSGAVLPGVTVEAASPVLIEKVRSAITDGAGRYSVLDLRPGTYRVTFTLPGFRTIIREGVELSGTAVVAINADMTVGGVQETITVSGQTPAVDLQSTTRQTSMNAEIVTAIPTSRNGFAVGVLIPGVTLGTGGNANQDVGGSLGPSTFSLVTHGGRLEDQRMSVNGVALSTMIGGGWGGGSVPNATGTQEFAIDTAAVDATFATGGVRINFIPKDGGNTHSGSVFASLARESFASTNLNADLVARGLNSVGNVKVNGDFNPGFGGPISRDKLWFYLSGRYQVADLYEPGFYNKNENDPTKWTYEADPSRRIIAPRRFQVYMGRFTWQASLKNKIGFTFEQERLCFCPDDVGPEAAPDPTTSPEAGNDRRFPLQRFVQVDWNTPVSNRLLVEASVIHRVERWGDMAIQTGNDGGLTSIDPRMISVLDTSTNFMYRLNNEFNDSWNKNLHYRAAVSYITGSHVFKVGFNNAWGYHDNKVYSAESIIPGYGPAQGVQYTFNGVTPSALALRSHPRTSKVEVDNDLGLFVQDKWTTGRWTLAGGLRYDLYQNSFPEQSFGGTTFPRISNLSWNDLTPKLGATYDVMGNGRTALKVTLNKYLIGLGTLGLFDNAITSGPSPINRLRTNTTRTWNDADGDYVPDCAIFAVAANGECGPLADPFFNTLQGANDYDPDLLTGWNKRNYNWEFSVGVQQELAPRVGIDVSYFRRWYGNFPVWDDRSAGVADYDLAHVTVPTDPRLPNGGGYTVSVYDLKSNRPLSNINYLAPDGLKTETWQGLDVSTNIRMSNGLVVQGGLSGGYRVRDDCALAATNPEILHEFIWTGPTRGFFFAARPLELCHRADPWQTQLKGLVSYIIPKADVQISATFQSLPGPIIEANYNAFSSGDLGRPWSIGPFRTIQIIPNGDVTGDRLNQVDFRASKIFRAGRTRTLVNFDFYNLLNANPVIAENAAYGAWRPGVGRAPLGVLQARFFKIGAQFDF
ncbi:MAG TPA: carboxypeptidase regulatory-like domain-containing protein [Vicinamibacterales bacterium]|nr:carboxypeptidase regulatory-like domain-containing protein [Vicinamibacterales bacterium]